MTPPEGILFCRRFSHEIEALASIWSTSATTTNVWRATGRTWPTNSQPFEVVNENNLRGVAKPGAVLTDHCLRAAHEKIVSDLAFALGLPVPPVILWDRGEGHVGDRNCAISAIAFPKFVEWHIAFPTLTPAQKELARYSAGAMRAFDTWVAASDRKSDHVLVEDDGDHSKLGLAQIDYAFALSYELGIGPGRKGIDPRPAFPASVGFDPVAGAKVADAILALDERYIAEIVNRVPIGYFIGNAREVIISALISRRIQLKMWLGL
jgi:hypothetical protein